MKKLLLEIDGDEFSEFLWHDTNHTWNEKMTVEEQIKCAHKLAQFDIDSLKKVPKLIDKKIKRFKELKEMIKYIEKCKDDMNGV